MDILYVCNEKMRRSYMLEAIFNRICTINNISPITLNIKNNLVCLEKNNGLKNSVFLLLDKIRKMMTFK